MRQTTTARSFMFAIILIFSLGLASNANATGKERPDANNEGFIAASDSGVTVATAHEWTVEEMENAKPMTPPMVAETTFPEITTGLPDVTTDVSLPDGPAGSIPGTLPTDLSADNIGLFASGEVSSYSSYPFSAVGKLFFVTPRGRSSCSASVIKGNEIWTAGHCVHAGNGSSSGWFSDFVFVPQYRNGSAPCGQWEVADVVTSSAWFNSGSNDQDYAKGSISNPNTGCTGTLGFAYNQSYNQDFLAVGYPGNIGGGQRMIFCSNPLKRTLSGNPAPFSIDCPMTQGSSGGPYIIRNDELNGNVSFGIPSVYPNEVFSPYFGSGAKSLYDYSF